MRVVISSGHAKQVPGALGIIDEVTEARRVVGEVVDWLRKAGRGVVEFHDDTSTTQQENLDTIINFHNAQDRDLDISVHFNASKPTADPVGTEVFYLTQEDLAARVSEAIASAGLLINRGAKKSTNLAFLNGTDMPAILIEVCFVDSEADVATYQSNFEAICKAIGTTRLADPITGDQAVRFEGKCSWFGGPDDSGVASDEGLAFIYDVDDAPHLFLDEQPDDTTGLARRLDPDVYYVACRWDYDVTPKEMLATTQHALVTAKKTGRQMLAWPADWGPHEDTGRVADISPGLMEALDIVTDDEIEVIYPASKPKRKEKRHASGKSSAARRHVRRSAGKKHSRNPKKSRRGVRKGGQARKTPRTQKRRKGRAKKR